MMKLSEEHSSDIGDLGFAFATVSGRRVVPCLEAVTTPVFFNVHPHRTESLDMSGAEKEETPDVSES
jgi:hypothetical protein